jgi:predicted Zn-dependent protease
VPVEDLKTYYRDRFDITVEALPLLPFEQRTYDSGRHQLIAEELVAQIKRGYPRQAQDQNAILIGITDGDMYIRAMDWRFGFNYRSDDRFAVVSCARMNPINLGQPADDELLRSRVRKMLTKNIGILYFKKEASTNPKSVLYNKVLGLEDLDYMGEEF